MSTVSSQDMGRIAVDGIDLEYELRGAGEPVVLIHWGVAAAWAQPLLEAAALAGHHRLLHYHRAGFGGSDRLPGPITMADHASHCARLMRRLGIESAHIVGHSSSAAIALQLALDEPRAVLTLTLMEPARPVPATEVQQAFLREVVAPAVQAYRAGDAPGAVDAWFRGVFGAGYREGLERALPGALQQAIADADAFFAQELLALQGWSFTEDDARRIEQRVLLVAGSRTTVAFRERVELLASWLPRVETCELPDATHLLHLENPRGMAEAMTSFYARRPPAT
jgi:pimeloyl-ACP methyl ester carboxylesterase